MLDTIMYIIAAGGLPVVINKTTEKYRLYWLQNHLRFIWMVIFAIFTMYFAHKSGVMGSLMDSLEKSGASQFAQYLMVAAAGAIVFCVYWWFIGNVFKERHVAEEQSKSAPPVVIQLPSIGNLKERAIALSEEIMRDLHERGWTTPLSSQLANRRHWTVHEQLPRDSEGVQRWTSRVIPN
jgi:heme/copper-type cytochrome/quinol oxidase subunit 1